MIGVLLGTHGVVLGRYLNGVAYPEVQMMKKIEALFAWSAAEQIDLIPGPGQDRDLRYSIVLRSVMTDWMEANPRTTQRADLRSLFPVRAKDPFAWKRGDRRPRQDVTKITPDVK
jgi:hypothetical protein